MSKEPKRNVYVGHRYVPKIMGEWDKAETYEGLSIVTNEGTSYTSKKRVPKGIDILNEEYWVVTGNYNAQIEEYRKDVREVEKEVNKKADQTFVDSEIERLEQKDKNLTTQLAQTTTKTEGFISSSSFNSLQEAINEAGRTGQKLIVSPGTYTLTTGLIINKPITIEGSIHDVTLDFSSMTEGVAITVGDGSEINGLVMNGLRIRGNYNISALQLNKTKSGSTPVRDSVFKNMRIENFEIGLEGYYSWCNLFENIRFQSCKTPFELRDQFNNSNFVRCSFVSYSETPRLTNCEGIQFDSANFGNISAPYAVELFQSSVVMVNPYIEYVGNINFARVGSSNEAIVSLLTLISPKITDDYIGIVCDGFDSQIKVLSTDKPIYINQHNDRITDGKSSSNIKIDNPNKKYPEYLFNYDGQDNFDFKIAYGGGSLTPVFKDGIVELTLEGSESNGIKLSDSLVIGERYTLLYATKNAKQSFRNGDIVGFKKLSDGFTLYAFYFKARDETARLLWDVEETNVLKKVQLIKGQYMPNG